ncbi:MAG TPA: alpha/beta hydrolase [Micromonosporaceae bacterium]|nr:alpha/beta hydrolase [Micromonosporaceae bacterium]
MASVASADGTVVAYAVAGSGPGLVVVPGTLRTARHYRALAGHLAGSYTVYTVDRRGRGCGGPPRSAYSMARECEDMLAVLDRTRATALFGHGYGGLVALEVALRHPLKKLAVYEPGLSVSGSFPDGWLPAFQHALARDRPGEAMAILAKGTAGTGTALGSLPTPLLAVLMRGAMMLMRGAMACPQARESAGLMPTVPAEVREIRMLDSTVHRYRDITADTLVLIGERGPAYLHRPARVLESTVPRARMVWLPGLSHSAPDRQAPRAVADQLLRFLTSPVSS